MLCRLRNNTGFFDFAFTGINANCLWLCVRLHKDLAPLGDVTQFLMMAIGNQCAEGELIALAVQHVEGINLARIGLVLQYVMLPS